MSEERKVEPVRWAVGAGAVSAMLRAQADAVANMGDDIRLEVFGAPDGAGIMIVRWGALLPPRDVETDE